MADLSNDLRQLFSHAVLHRTGRLSEADVRFTYSPTDVYLSCFAAALEQVNQVEPVSVDYELLRYAQVLERFVLDPHTSIDGQE